MNDQTKGSNAADTKGADKAPEETAEAKAKRLAAEKAAKDAADAKARREAMFAKLPTIKVHEDAEVVDMSGVECTNPYKYDKVHNDAIAEKLPVKRGWKHMQAMFIPGTNKGGENGFRQGSVYGTIQDIVNKAGRSGISAQALVTQVRQRQIGNKRSKYCDKLPPVGWAEGWIDTAVTKNIIGQHATKKAPSLLAPAPAPAADEAKGQEQKAA